MRRGMLAPAGVVLSLGLLAHAGARASDTTMRKGAALFAKKCAVCHGANGEGDGPAGAALNPPPANFTSPAFWKHQTDQTIAATIRKGHGDMPPMDQNPEDVKALTRYLTSFRKQ